MKALTFPKLRKLTEDQGRDMLEAIRWPDGPVCPHCQSKKAWKLEPTSKGKTHVRAGVYTCGDCRKQFTVTVGTIFEGGHIRIADWLLAIYLMCSSKKGISAHQLHRTIGVTYKTAWFMAHRIRFAMTQGPLAELLKGTVELDATYIGGHERYKHEDKKTEGVHGSAEKTPVFALVERGGELRAKKMPILSNYNIRWAVREHVNREAHLMTDEANAYLLLDKWYANRQFVNHGAKQYVNGDIHVNTLEGWFALLKRGVTGTFHHVSEQHLDRYVDEFVFRYNSRKITDAERAVRAIERVGGKRLTYRETASPRPPRGRDHRP